jgi:hypothetical protein
MERENLIFEINNFVNDKNVSYREKLDLILSYIKKLYRKNEIDEMLYWMNKWESLYNEWKEKVESNKKNKTEKDFLVKSFKKFMMFKMNLEILKNKNRKESKVVNEDEIFG